MWQGSGSRGGEQGSSCSKLSRGSMTQHGEQGEESNRVGWRTWCNSGGARGSRGGAMTSGCVDALWMQVALVGAVEEKDPHEGIRTMDDYWSKMKACWPKHDNLN